MQAIFTNNSIFLKFENQPQIKEILQNIKGRKYDIFSKQWEIPINTEQELIDKIIIEYEFEIIDQTVEIVQKQISPIRDLFKKKTQNEEKPISSKVYIDIKNIQIPIENLILMNAFFERKTKLIENIIPDKKIQKTTSINENKEEILPF